MARVECRFVLPDGAGASVSVGVSDIVSQRPLVSTDLMLAGSVGKTFVAATMLQLAQEGKLNLDDKIER
jgi:D-alanyl-D-alanine carboxypeptidase